MSRSFHCREVLKGCAQNCSYGFMPFLRGGHARLIYVSTKNRWNDLLLVPLLQENSSVKFAVLEGKLVLAEVLMEYALIAIMYFYYTNWPLLITVMIVQRLLSETFWERERARDYCCVYCHVYAAFNCLSLHLFFIIYRHWLPCLTGIYQNLADSICTYLCIFSFAPQKSILLILSSPQNSTNHSFLSSNVTSWSQVGHHILMS